MKFIRWFLGKNILILDAIFSPKSPTRAPKDQAIMDLKAKQLALYQFEACPFCVKVRRAIKRQSIHIELRDAKNNELHRETLLEQGGRVKVPCLRIENGDKTTWMYESNDIIAYLEKEFPIVP